MQAGIGNYLRAEILHRACVHPSVPAKDLFANAKKLFPSFDFDMVNENTDKGMDFIINYSDMLQACLSYIFARPSPRKFCLWD